MVPAVNRARALEELSKSHFDLLVIGAGIVGSRIAYDGARAGLRVALVDAGDFGHATSSASSKLIHGGLRYLPMGDLALIREAHLERVALMTRVAPHLVRPLRFLLPVYGGGPHRTALIAAGLFVYAALSGFREAEIQVVRPARAHDLIPAVQLRGMRSAALFEDAQTHDSRLVLATVAGAAREGAVVVNYAGVTALERGLAHVLVGGEALEVSFEHAVNAAGPWVDRVRMLEHPGCAPVTRLSKGVHVLMPGVKDWQAALAVPLPRDRVAFAVPWLGMLLLGTTDTEYEGDPGAVSVTDEDVETVLKEAARGLPPELLRREHIRYSFAGLRVLPVGEGDTALARRGHVVHVGSKGVVSVAGGKLTTHRQIARDVLRRLPGKPPELRHDSLPGAGPLPPRPEALEADVWTHLTHLYGSEADRVLAYPGAAERIHPGGPDVWGQVLYAAEQEWALTPDDVTRRRTTLDIRGLTTPTIRERITTLLAGRVSR